MLRKTITAESVASGATPEERLATVAGWASLAAGLTLAVAPGAGGELVGLIGAPSVLRAYGAGELAIGGGLLLSGDGARWVGARAVWDLVLAGLGGRALAMGTPHRGRAGALLALMVVLAAVNGWVARRLASAPAA